MITENGWPSCGSDMLDRSPIPGTDIVIPLQIGYPSRIMKAFAADFHAFVESLYNGRGGTDEGGWTPTNSVATSNHLGGTAMDLNWTDHTFQVSYSGFTDAEISTTRELLRFYENLIWWGQDWTSPKDCMHFQMGYDTYGQNAKMDDFIARKIRADGFSTFKRGSSEIARKIMVPDAGGTFWCDVSQYQSSALTNSYPYQVFSFRTNSGDVEDTLVDENASAAKQLLDSGQLQIVIPYYFFRPGEANCDLHREILERTGLFNHPRSITMVDVEGANGQVAGDNSWEINDEVNRIRGWYGNYNRVIGYYNSNADPALWPTRAGINLVVPQYNRTPGDISSIFDSQVRSDAIAHQYTSNGNVAQWNPVDINWSPYNINELLALFGLKDIAAQTIPPDAVTTTTEDDEVSPELEKMIREIHGCLFNQIPSQSRYRADGEGSRWQLHELIKNDDAFDHEEDVEKHAIFGHVDSIRLVERNTRRGDSLARSAFNRIPDEFLTQLSIARDSVESDYAASKLADPNRTVFAISNGGK